MLATESFIALHVMGEGSAFMLLAFTLEAVPSPFAGAPGLGVPLSSSLFTFALDASGDRDIPVVVPVTASLGSLQARIQVVALAASGVLSKSNVAVTSLAPSPAGGILTSRARGTARSRIRQWGVLC